MHCVRRMADPCTWSPGSLVRLMPCHQARRLNAKHKDVLGHCAMREWGRRLVSNSAALRYFSSEVSKYHCVDIHKSTQISIQAVF